MNEIELLRKYQKRISEIQYTINLLSWDLKISTPEQSTDSQISLIASYEDKLFKLQTSKKYEKLLNDAISSSQFNDLPEPEQRYIYNLLRHYKEKINIPSSFYSKYQKILGESNVIWRKAKITNNYEMFKPYLRQVIEYTKQFYTYLNINNDNIYDVMLNNYETGFTSEIIDNMFNKLKESLIPLINEVNQNEQHYQKKISEEKLLECAKFLLDYIGFDMSKGYISIYPHGFTEKMNATDIRIAIRNVNNPCNFIKTVIHEGGHGIYEQNIAPNLSQYENTTVDNLYALHESQSRFYENILGRNINFWIPIYDKVKEILNLELSLHDFISQMNAVQCGLIRTNADELTYCMHIILRYEIERDLFNNKITVDDLPFIWDQKMKEYLNVDVDTDSNGIMQDIHWSEGNFGYFPSYLLGTIYDGMFIETIEKDLGNIDVLLKKGEIKKITNYLINNIYKNGGAYTTEEVIKKMCGSPISTEPIIKYFRKKYIK